MSIECPSCGFAGATLSAEATRTCSRCGRQWDAPLEYPARPPITPPRRSRWSPNAAYIGFAVLALFVVVRVIAETADWWVEGPAANDVAAVPLPGSNAPPERPVEGAAEVGPKVGQGKSRLGAWWLVEYRNTGVTTIALPQVQLSLTSPEGGGREDFPATIGALPPGQSTWLLLLAGSWHDDVAATFKIIGPHAALPGDPVFTRLEVLDIEWTHGPKDHGVIVGSVNNGLDHPVDLYAISAVGFDLEGAPCAYAQAFPSVQPLASGASQPFEMQTGVWQSALPATWELHVWGRYQPVISAQE